MVSVLTLPGFEVQRTAWEANGFTAFDAISRDSGERVLLKHWPYGHPPSSPEQDPIWREQYALRQIDAAAFPYTLRHQAHASGSWGVMPWYAGTPLGGKTFAAGEARLSALAVIETAAISLDYLHTAGGVHGSLSPDSILWCQATRTVRFSDLGFVLLPMLPWIGRARLLEHEKALYSSPEGTGRVGAELDYRGDFYSLGAILYQMLVGKPPFDFTDPLRLAHAHLARRPLPPSSVDASIPPALSDIVLRLLEKTPEARYRSGAGIAADLSRCRKELAATGRCASFDLGHSDVPTQLRLSTKLYGRTAAQQQVLGAYEGLKDGGRGLVMVSGYSGVGKTSLVESIRRNIMEDDGFLAIGKFQQSASAQPFVGVARSVAHLAHQLLTLPEERLSSWRSRLEESLGRNVQVLTKLVPEMDLVVQAGPGNLEISADEARTQFLVTIKRFVRLFTAKGSPFVLFLDDVQWMDPASGELLNDLLSEPDIEHFLVITAYRNNEVEVGSALDSMLASPPAVSKVDIALEPLDHEATVGFLIDSFACTAGDAMELAEVLKAKTDGNPFFLRTYVASMADVGLIRYAIDGHAWRWDLDEIRHWQVSENVVDFMRERLKAYSQDVQDLLNTMACVGGIVSEDTLSRAADLTGESCAQLLVAPLSDGLVSRVSTPDVTTSDAYRFTHDRIEQAAYALVDEDVRPRRHAAIAHRMYDSGNGLDRGVFALAEHLDKAGSEGAEVLSSHDLVRIYLGAGKQAKENTAYAAARYYLERAATYVERSGPNERAQFDSDLYHTQAEVEYQLGELAASRAFVNVALRHCHQPLEQADLHMLLIVQDTLQGHYQEALDRGRYALSLLDFDLPRTNIEDALDETINALSSIDIEQQYAKLLKMRVAKDPVVVKILDILMYLIPPSYFVHTGLNNLIASLMTRFTLEHGICPSGAKGLSNFGPAIAERGRFREGYLMARLALELAEKHGYVKVRPRILYTLAGSLNHWVNHLRTSRGIVDTGFSQSIEQGERDYGGYLLTLARCQNEIFLGRPIDAFKTEVAEIREYAESTQNALGKGLAAAAYMALSHLDGSTKDESPFDIGDLREPALLKSIAVHDHRLVGCYFQLLKAHNFCFLGRFDDAADSVAAASKYRDSLSTEMTLPMLNLFSSLAVLGQHARGKWAEGEREAALEQVRHNQEEMRQWSRGCPENFLHCLMIVEGELAAAEERTLDAVGSFEEAIRTARENDYPQFEGLAQSLLAEFWRRQGHPNHADLCLAGARACYERWGAKRLVQQIDAATQLRGDVAKVSSDIREGDDVELRNEQLDLAALFELTQRLSSEIDLQGLKSSLASAILEVTGAQKVVLLLAEDGVYEPAIAMDIEGRSSDGNDATFPVALVNLVSRTREASVVSDGVPDASVAHDSYLRETTPVSALCLPLIRQRELEGLVYVENRINRIDLSERKLRYLSLLGAQAAISIRNAVLYSDLESKVEDRTRALTRLTSELEARVERQVDEIRKLQRLRRFLSPQVADLILSSKTEDLLKSHRRGIAVLFCDLRGYTAFSEAVEPEEAIEMLKTYHWTLGEIVRKHRATVDHLAGDGIMVFLGDPIASERPIEESVEMAVEMRAAIETMISELDPANPGLGFGIGITYGYATIGLIGDEERMEYSATGRHVNLASRLCHEASANQILVTQRIASAVADSYASELVNMIQFKGFSQPIPVFNIVERKPDQAGRTATSAA